MTNGRRSVVLISGIVVLALAFCALLLRLHQRQLRLIAGQVIPVLQQVRVGSNACQELATWTARWGANVTTRGSCDGSSFYMGFALNPPEVLVRMSQHNSQMVRRSFDAYQLLAGRLFSVGAEVWADKGVVTLTEISFMQVVPNENSREYLQTIVRAVARVHDFTNTRPHRPPPNALEFYQRSTHPAYEVFRHSGVTNLDTFGPLNRVNTVGVDLVSTATREDLTRLMSFDLSCATRFRGCTESDLMPSVYEQYQRDAGAVATVNGKNSGRVAE